MEEINVTKEALDLQAKELVMELGKRVYHIGLLESEVADLKAKLLEVNVKAYKLINEPEEQAGDDEPVPAAVGGDNGEE